MQESAFAWLVLFCRLGLYPPMAGEGQDRMTRLPHGVGEHALQRHADERGVFIETFRDNWIDGPKPVQWNVVHSNRDVLRGVHVHAVHHDYLTVLSGRLLLGLRDIRESSPTVGMTVMLTLTPQVPRVISVPPGIAHGFYYPEPAVHLYSVSEFWNTDDEMGCRWDDPSLGMAWPTENPVLSERDRTAGSLEAMIAEFRTKRRAAGKERPS
jgi:dTDP-4-dehydrorhamnose 3,5-epimerase